jgi:hypothetical protein
MTRRVCFLAALQPPAAERGRGRGDTAWSQRHPEPHAPRGTRNFFHIIHHRGRGRGVAPDCRLHGRGLPDPEGARSGLGNLNS